MSLMPLRGLELVCLLTGGLDYSSRRQNLDSFVT